MPTLNQTTDAETELKELLERGISLSVEERIEQESLVYAKLQVGKQFKQWLDDRPISKNPNLNSKSPAVITERQNDQLFVTLNRPERHNAYNAQMRDELIETLLLIKADNSIKEILISGNGKSFCAGGDLDEFGTTTDPKVAHQIRMERNVALLLHQLRDRVKFRLHGYCVGAGIELPAFSNYVEAEPDMVCMLPELKMGLIPGAGGTASLPERIGKEQTEWLAISGEQIDAKTALEWGLIDKII